VSVEVSLRREIGERFVDLVASRDFAALEATVTEDVRFRLLVPRGHQDQAGISETVGRFRGWFADADDFRLESSSVSTVAGRIVVSYRFRLHDAEGWRLIEQHLVIDAAPDGRLTGLDLLCTGFHPDQRD